MITAIRRQIWKRTETCKDTDPYMYTNADTGTCGIQMQFQKLQEFQET